MATKPKLSKGKVMEKLRLSGYENEKDLESLNESLIYNTDFSREELIIAFQIRDAMKKGILYSYLINPEIDLQQKEDKSNAKQV